MGNRGQYMENTSNSVDVAGIHVRCRPKPIKCNKILIV